MRANARPPGVCFDLEYQVRGLPQRGILARLMTASGQSRRLNDVGMSASPPTTDVSLRRSEPTLWAMYGRRPRCKMNLAFCEAFGCSHVSGLT